MTTLFEKADWLLVSGLCWDISGALWLAKGLLLDDKQIARRAGTYYDLSPPAARGLCEQRTDARFGITIIVIGILIELLAALRLEVPAGAAAVVVTPLMCTFHYYRRMYLFWVTRDSLLFAGFPVDQRTWRYHFPDVSDPDWSSAISEQERILRSRGQIA